MIGSDQVGAGDWVGLDGEAAGEGWPSALACRSVCHGGRGIWRNLVMDPDSVASKMVEVELSTVGSGDCQIPAMLLVLCDAIMRGFSGIAK